LDGQQVMTMFRRSPKPASPLRNRQEELIRREAELRARVEELERMIADTSRLTHSGSQQVREERPTMEGVDKRLRVSIALDESCIDETKEKRRPRSLRKQRREGRWIFLLLLVAFAAALIWLLTHLPF
jgi:t-SNARE complex subunit (syntaxin)